MIPLTLALSLQGRGDIIGSSPLRGEGWERVQNEYYFDTVNKYYKMKCNPTAVGDINFFHRKVSGKCFKKFLIAIMII